MRLKQPQESYPQVAQVTQTANIPTDDSNMVEKTPSDPSTLSGDGKYLLKDPGLLQVNQIYSQVTLTYKKVTSKCILHGDS